MPTNPVLRNLTHNMPILAIVEIEDIVQKLAQNDPHIQNTPEPQNLTKRQRRQRARPLLLASPDIQILWLVNKGLAATVLSTLKPHLTPAEFTLWAQHIHLVESRQTNTTKSPCAQEQDDQTVSPPATNTTHQSETSHSEHPTNG